VFHPPQVLLYGFPVRTFCHSSLLSAAAGTIQKASPIDLPTGEVEISRLRTLIARLTLLTLGTAFAAYRCFNRLNDDLSDGAIILDRIEFQGPMQIGGHIDNQLLAGKCR
jgi:hypothetical protein